MSSLFTKTLVVFVALLLSVTPEFLSAQCNTVPVGTPACVFCCVKYCDGVHTPGSADWKTCLENCRMGTGAGIPFPCQCNGNDPHPVALPDCAGETAGSYPCAACCAKSCAVYYDKSTDKARWLGCVKECQKGTGGNAPCKCGGTGSPLPIPDYCTVCCHDQCTTPGDHADCLELCPGDGWPAGGNPKCHFVSVPCPSPPQYPCPPCCHPCPPRCGPCPTIRRPRLLERCRLFRRCR